MWTLRQLQEWDVQAEINGKWVSCRSENYKCRTLWERISEAWAVFVGRAEAFTWPEGQ